MPHHENLSKTSPYGLRINSLRNESPHLQSLSLYMEAIVRERNDSTRRIGSHDSDSVLAAEISSTSRTTYHRIDCYDAVDVKSHYDMLSGKGDERNVIAGILVVEVLSPAATEALGSGFHLDPHVFYFHLGFVTRRSAMAELVDAANENEIPVTWCMPSHTPEGFISVPVPCDLKPARVRKTESGLQEDSTYSRQACRPLASFSGKDAGKPTQRAFHRISLVFPKSEIETVVILAFPMWKRLSQMQSAVQSKNSSEWPLAGVIDLYGFGLVPPKVEAVGATEMPLKKGDWSDGQWERVQPLFQIVMHGLSPTAEKLDTLLEPGILRHRALVRLYSKMNHNYHLACQNLGRCWRDIRELLDEDPARTLVFQRPKRQFRDSMT